MGGAERNLAQIAEGLQARGVEQHVVCAAARGMWADELERKKIPVTVLGIRSVADAPSGLLKLFQLVSGMRPHVLQGWMYHGNLLAALVHRITAARERRLFWNLRASNMDEGGYGRILRWSARLSAWPDVIISNSQTGLDFHVAQGFKPRATKIIPNGIDTDKFKPDQALGSRLRRELAIPDGAFVAIHVARLDPMKDHMLFLESMAARPDIYGLLVGAGTEKLTLPDNVRSLGLRRDVERIYACADVVVSTSAFGEGFSNVLAEGMSAGLVPVATDVGDSKLVIGDTGYLIPRRDPEMLAKTLGIEGARAQGERRSRGLKARAWIVDNFSLRRAVDRYERLYIHA